MSENQRVDEAMENFMTSYGKDKNGDDLKTRLEKMEFERQRIIMDFNKRVVEDLLKDNATRPVRVKGVNLVGPRIGQFRDTFLAYQLRPLLKNNHQLTLEEYLKNIDLTTDNLVKTGTIANLGMQVIPIDYKSPFSSGDTLELITNINVEPVKKLFMKVGTNIGNSEGDGYFTANYKNIFGGGENLSFDTSIGSNTSGKKTKSQYYLNYEMPIMNNGNYKFNSVLYHSSRFIDYTTYHEQEIDGITNRISTNYGLGHINHELSSELFLRSLRLHQSLSSYRNNSLITDYHLFHAGDSIKSNLIYNISYDTRDSQILAKKGLSFKNIFEISGILTQDKCKFIKNSTELSYAKTLYESIIVNANVKGGVIKNLTPETSINPMDKFQLGGSNDIRGFQLSGLGPKQMGLSIGGDAFLGMGLSVFSRVPFISKESNFKIHNFINAGKLFSLSNDGKMNLPQGLANGLKSFSSSCGIGLVFGHPSARFELNFVLPLTSHHGDEIRKGVQYGIGLSFM